MKPALRASLADKEAHRMRDVELVPWASSLKILEIAGGTVDSDFVHEDTIEGVQTKEVLGSGEPDTPAC